MVKHTLKMATIILIFISWWVLPAGPTDIFFIPFLISIFTLQGYLIISAILVFLLYDSIEGKTIKSKINTIKQEVMK